MSRVDHLTFLGHSTIVFDMGDVRVITDPILRSRVGPLRRHGPPPDPSTFDGAAVVLLSHLHWDHFDIPSLERLGRHVTLVVPAGSGGLLSARGFRDVRELWPGEVTDVGGLTIGATKARHVSFRPPFGPSTPSLGFVIEGKERVYFAGDTDIFPEMADLGELDLALLPVWGWGPRLGEGHMDPLRAVESLELLKPRGVMPIHWGSLWPYGLGRYRTTLLTHPPQAFAQIAAERAPGVVLHLAAPGERIRIRH